MKTLTEKAFVATGIEMFQAGLFGENTGKNQVLWIKWHWDPNSEKEKFAPVADIFSEKSEKTTHRIIDEEMYFELPLSENGEFMFENFIQKFIPIEQVLKDDTVTS